VGPRHKVDRWSGTRRGETGGPAAPFLSSQFQDINLID
jgi:hypothetical protein